MRNLIIFIFCLVTMSFTKWEPDFETAKKIAVREHRLILLNFSGSDWCIPCIRMHKEIFANKAFNQMADSELVLLNADFPRNRKNQLSKQSREHNELLAGKYNPKGKFPYTVLLNAEGKVLQTWDGMPDKNAEAFALQIKIICDANSH